MTVTGSKPAGTGIWLNGSAAVPIGPSSRWSYDVPLSVGENRLDFVARDGAGNQSAPARLTITRGAVPSSLSVDPPVSPTNAASALLSGSKSPDATVEINASLVAHTSGDRWSKIMPLTEGLNTFSVMERMGGAAGAAVVVTVLRDSVPPRPPANLRSTPSRTACVAADEVDVQWDAATDSGTGVAGYRYRWDTSPEGDASGGGTTAVTALHASLGPGRWYLHLAAVDAATNVSSVRHYGPICLLTRGGVMAGAVFIDLDADGRLDDDPGLGGWHAEARSPDARLEATTAADGSYWMEGPPGSYVVCVRPPSRSRGRWTPGPGISEQDGAFCRSVEAKAEAELAWHDFGFYEPATVQGLVFADRNGDGDERGLGGVAVRAVDGGGRSLTAVSGDDGAYALALSPGEYLLCALPPLGMTVTSRTPDGGCVALAVRSAHDVDGPAFGVAPR